MQKAQPDPFAPIARHARRMLAAMDRYFIDESIAARGVEVLTCTRMGVVASFFIGSGILGALALVSKPFWSLAATLLLTSIGAATIGLPFLLRRRDALVHVGHGVCAAMVLYAVAAPVLTGAPDGSSLAIIPVVPVIAAVACRGRACAAWGAIVLAVLALAYLAVVLDLAGSLAELRARDSNRIFAASVAAVVVTGLGTISRAISDRSVADIADFALTSVHARDARYRALLEHASEGISVFDKNARVTYSSPAVRRLFDLGDESPVGRTMASFTHPDDLVEHVAEWNEVRSSKGQVVRVQFRGRGHADSEWKHFDAILSNHLETPDVHGIVVHLRDVTELRQSDEKYRLLVDNSLHGVAVVVGSSIVYANRALGDIVGVPFEKIPTMGIPDLLDFDRAADRDRILDAWETSASQLTDDVAIPIRHTREPLRFIQMRWMEIVWSGRPARQVIFVDVTAERRLDEARALQQKELEIRIEERTRELEISQQRLRDAERLASLGTLAAGVAHQINNPVGSILACAELGLLEADDDGEDSSQVRLFDDIRKQAIRCGRIANGLLQFARKKSSSKSLGHMVSVVRNAIGMCKAEANRRAASVDFDYEPEFEASWVMIDSIQIEQVFVNLIRNALESRPEGVRVDIHGWIEAGDALVSVTDDGPGIAEVDRPHIFEPFFTTRLFQGGTGLGLSVAHGIVEEHDGSLSLDPDSTQGTRFQLRLPTVIQPPETA